jgi:hypothetical protein
VKIANTSDNGIIEKILLFALKRFGLSNELDSTDGVQFHLWFFDDEAIVPDPNFKRENCISIP